MAYKSLRDMASSLPSIILPARHGIGCPPPCAGVHEVTSRVRFGRRRMPCSQKAASVRGVLHNEGIPGADVVDVFIISYSHADNQRNWVTKFEEALKDSLCGISPPRSNSPRPSACHGGVYKICSLSSEKRDGGYELNHVRSFARFRASSRLPARRTWGRDSFSYLSVFRT